MAVYTVDSAKLPVTPVVSSDSYHATVPVYWVWSIAAVLGVAPVTGAVTSESSASAFTVVAHEIFLIASFPESAT